MGKEDVLRKFETVSNSFQERDDWFYEMDRFCECIDVNRIIPDDRNGLVEALIEIIQSTSKRLPDGSDPDDVYKWMATEIAWKYKLVEIKPYAQQFRKKWIQENKPVPAVAKTYEKYFPEQDKDLIASDELAQYLKMEYIPFDIEVFGIYEVEEAKLLGTMMVLRKEKPFYEVSHKFKPAELDDKPDEAVAMAHIVKRRFEMWLKTRVGLPVDEHDPSGKGIYGWPDLVIVLGDQNCFKAALASVRGLEIDYITVIGLDKELEHIYTEGSDMPLNMPAQPAAMELLRKIREESHKFATTVQQNPKKKWWSFLGIGKRTEKQT